MIRWMPVAISLLTAASVVQCGSSTGSDGGPAHRLHGLNFSPYVAGQDPNRGSEVSEEQVRARLEIIAPHVEWVRTFGSTHGLEAAGELAHELGLKTAVGAWLGRDRSANEAEIASLIAAAQAGDVDVAIVGNEVLLRGDLTAQELIAYITRVRDAIPSSIPVTTAEICGVLLSNPDIVGAIDIVFANHYPYWEGVPLDCALGALRDCHTRLVAIAGGKQVVISETGWPSCGNPVGNAEPGPEAAKTYLHRFVSWARANEVPFFYFEAFDEAWKADYEGPQGACWGLWDEGGDLKDGVEEVFTTEIVTAEPLVEEIPGGAGIPSLELTYVPEYGSYDDLRGQVRHVRPADYRVAVYIYVSGWWTKPYWDRPATPIACDGSWVCDITTGGVDQRATRIAAYLVPADFDPPLMRGGASLPQTLLDTAVAAVEHRRTP